jgi:hypothetical protein
VKYGLLLIFFLSTLFTHSQKEQIPVIKQSGKEISEFIPSGWEGVVEHMADLNLDSLNDVMLVVKIKGEDSLSTAEHPVKRIFMLLIAQRDNTFKLTVRNENVIYHYNYDGNFKDALVDVNVRKGMFSIDHYGGFAMRWGRTSVFKYNVKEKNWFLTNDEYSEFSATDPDNTEKEIRRPPKNFGKISINKFDIYKQLK